MVLLSCFRYSNRATLTMSTDCDYVFNELLPEKSPVSTRVVEGPANREVKSVISHRLKDGPILKKKIVKKRKSMSKNAIRMREKQKNRDYRRGENEGRKLQLRETRKKQIEEKC